MNCVHCGKTLKATATFCSGCGKSVAQTNENASPQANSSTTFCKQCGKTLKSTAAFCSGCGNTMSQTKGNAESQANVNAAPQTAPQNKFCKQCGKTLKATAAFCSGCGADVARVTPHAASLQAKLPFKINKKKLTPVASVALVLIVLGIGGSFLWSLFFGANPLQIEFNNSAFELLSVNDDTQEEIFLATERVDVLSGTVPGNHEVISMNIRVMVGELEIFSDEISPSLQWTYNRPALMQGYNTIMVNALLSTGDSIEGTLSLISAHAGNFGASALDWNDSVGDGLYNWQREALGADYDDFIEFRDSLADNAFDDIGDNFGASVTYTTFAGEPSVFMPVTASATMTLAGDLVGTLSVSPVTVADNFWLAPTIPGYLGLAHSISVEGAFNSAEITFYYDTSLGTPGADFQPQIYRVDEYAGFIELPNQVVVGGHVTATIDQQAIYMLLNSAEFNAVWDVDIRPPAPQAAIRETPPDGIDLILVIDESNSMRTNDPQNIRVLAALEFSNVLTQNDRAAVIGFYAQARLLQGLTADMGDVANAINKITIMGGTAIHRGLTEALDEFDRNGRLEARRIIICLTDGEDSPRPAAGTYDTILARARDMGVTIYTIGLGARLDERLLVRLAHETGGLYYHATEAEDMHMVFGIVADDFDFDNLTDSNGDGIPDYYSQLIYEGKLRLMNGSAELMGTNFCLYPDMDGDGLLNGDEIEIIYVGGRVFMRLHSHPLLPDGDFDGIPDADDPIPMRPNFFHSHTADIDFLMTNENFRYSRYADGSNRNTLNILGDAFVMYLSRLNVQEIVTMQMAEFFASNVSEDYFYHLTVLTAREFMINETWQTVADITEAMLNGYIPKNEGGNRIRNLLTTLSISIEDSRDSGVDAFQSVAELNVTEWQLLGSTGTHVVKTFGSAYTSLINFLGMFEPFNDEVGRTVGGKIDEAFFAIGSVIATIDLIADSTRLWQMRSALIQDVTTMQMITKNMDVFTELRRTAPNAETRRAAQFMIDMTTGSVAGTLELQLDMITQAGLYTSVDLLLSGVAKLFPPLKIVTLGLNIANSILGWGDRLQARHQVLVIHDITNATVRMVGRVYHRSESDLNRHLTNLVNLRILGETRYYALSRNAANERAAEANRDNVRQRGSQMGIFIFE